MIPVSIFRLLLVLMMVSGVLVVAEAAVDHIGIRGPMADLCAGVFAGAMVFLLAYEWGRVLRFCAKGVVQSAALNAKVRAVLDEIGVKQEVLAVSIIDSKEFHGATVREGGGHRMFISTRFLDTLSSSALRGLLAHEYGHVENKHPIKLAALLGIVASVKLSVGVPLGAVVAILLAYLFMLREWEYVADEAACQHVGVDDVLAAFHEYRAASGDKSIGALSEFFCGHPSLHKRIAAVMRKQGGQ